MAAITSAASGPSSAAATWTGGVVPVEGDTVTIVSPHTVTVDADHTWGSGTGNALTINPGATLTFNTSASRTLTLKNNYVNNGSILIGSAASPVPAGSVINIVLNKGLAAESTVCGVTATTGIFKAYGASRTRRTTLTATAAAGALSINVADATGWAVGDEIFLLTTSHIPSANDRLTITGIVGNTIVVPALVNEHLVGGLVVNGSSNVRISNFGGATTRPIVQFLSTTAGNAYLSQVEMRQGYYWRFDNRVETVDCAWWGSFYGMYNLAGGTGALHTRPIAFSNSQAGMFMGCPNVTITFGVSLGNAYGVQVGAVANRITDTIMAGNTTGLFSNTTYGLYTARNQLYANFQAENLTNITAKCVNEESAFGFGLGGVQNNGNSPTGTRNVEISANTAADYVYVNCTFNGSEPVRLLSNLMPGSRISLARQGGVDDANTTYVAAGSIVQQTTVKRDSPYAVALNFTSSASPLDFDLTVVGKANSPLAVTGYLRKTATYGVGVALPTVTLSGLGMTDSVWTMTNVNDQWVQFIVSGTPTRSGLADLRIRGQAAAGTVYVDTIVVAGVTLNTGDFDLWHLGYPIEVILSTGLGALDVWQVPLSVARATVGSVGEKVSQDLTTGQYIALG